MKKEYQDNLIAKFPEFFTDLQEDQKIHTGENVKEIINELTNQESIVMPIQFGFECGDGWYWLLYEIMDTIYNYCNWNKVEIPKVLQIKEKYGALNFYFVGGNETVRGMVWFAEHLSRNICETCGTNKNVGSTRGWIYTICEKCLEKNPRAKELEWVPNKSV